MDYTVRELIHNQSFRRMVKGEANPSEIDRWNCWIEASGENRRKAKEAIAEIVGFEFRDFASTDLESEWDRLRNYTVRSSKLTNSNKSSSGLKWVYRVAVILILGVMVGIGTHIYSEKESNHTSVKQITQKKTIKTGANEQKTVIFSDGSKITLNSNSQMTYSLGVLHNKTIKVVLRGEAYFTANDPGKSKRVFAVHTPDGIIRDLGTKFLVSVQKNHSRVVLQSGKVEVDPKNESEVHSGVKLKKGEMLLFNQSSILNKKMVNPTYYTSWATGSMHFNHTTLKKFAGFVEKKFNVDVQIVNPKLDSIKIDGSIYFKSLAGLVRSVSKVAMVPAYQSRNGKIVYLGNKQG